MFCPVLRTIPELKLTLIKEKAPEAFFSARGENMQNHITIALKPKKVKPSP